jgi:hypothetical protein
MGSHFEQEIFDGKLTSSELRKRYDARIKDLLYEHGADAYNGTLTTTSGLRVEEKTFDSVEAAEEYVQANTNKWGEALAVKFKDIRTEVAKEPTYNGKKNSFPIGVNTRMLRSVASIWDDAKRQNVLLAADQLVVSQKAKAIALYSDWHTKNRAFDALRNSIAKICQRLQDSSAPLPQSAEFKELQKAIKQRARAHAAEKKAAEKLIAFDLKQAAKIYATKSVDHGVQWLVGGWAAE